MPPSHQTSVPPPLSHRPRLAWPPNVGVSPHQATGCRPLSPTSDAVYLESAQPPGAGSGPHDCPTPEAHATSRRSPALLADRLHRFPRPLAGVSERLEQLVEPRKTVHYEVTGSLRKDITQEQPGGSQEWGEVWGATAPPPRGHCPLPPCICRLESARAQYFWVPRRLQYAGRMIKSLAAGAQARGRGGG